MVIIAFSWGENVAGEGSEKKTKGDSDEEGISSFSEAWGQIFNGKDFLSPVLLVGAIQSLFEGGMYTFVFNWVPTLMTSYPEGVSAFFGIQGVVFTLFMLSISIGGSLYPLLHSDKGMGMGMSVGSVSVGVYVVAAGAMAVLATSSDFFVQLAALLVVEGCVGLFFVVVGTVRSMVLPSSALSTLMNIFRVPLNILVVVGTKMSDSEDISTSTVFMVCCVWFLMTAGCQILLNNGALATTGATGKAKGGKAE
jgi:hypothetical protein